MDPLLQELVTDVATQIRTLRERDHVAITDEQICERARSIVTVLMGLYDVRPWSTREARRRPDAEPSWCYPPEFADHVPEAAQRAGER